MGSYIFVLSSPCGDTAPPSSGAVDRAVGAKRSLAPCRRCCRFVPALHPRLRAAAGAVAGAAAAAGARPEGSACTPIFEKTDGGSAALEAATRNEVLRAPAKSPMLRGKRGVLVCAHVRDRSHTLALGDPPGHDVGVGITQVRR